MGEPSPDAVTRLKPLPRPVLYPAGLVGLLLLGIAVAVLRHPAPAPGRTPGVAAPGASSPSPRYAGVGDTASGGQGQDVGKIKCESHEQFVYHVHAHVSILVDGAPHRVAASIGIPGAEGGVPRCIYWMHTHDDSGVVHIESPTQALYTLGEFFDVWGMPLGRNGVADQAVPGGDLLVFVDGKQFDGDPRDVQLKGHTEVVIELGRAGPPPQFDFGKL